MHVGYKREKAEMEAGRLGRRLRDDEAQALAAGMERGMGFRREGELRVELIWYRGRGKKREEAKTV